MKTALPLLLSTLLLAACGSPPPVTPVPPASTHGKEVGTAPASREPLFVELVTIRREWVAKYAAGGPEQVNASAEALGSEVIKRLRNSPDAREAIADSVQAVLGEAAVADPDRPKTTVVERERLKDLRHLSAAVKAGVGQFADHARPGDVLDRPASDVDVVAVARAVPAKR